MEVHDQARKHLVVSCAQGLDHREVLVAQG
jgi:hypothetical protein